jgi:hypothetical protein
MKIGLALAMATACALVGCRTAQPSITRDLLAGKYMFVSEDPESRPTDHNLNQLVLRSDWTYDLVEGGTTRPVSEKKGIWRIIPRTPSNVVEVELDHSGFPIEIRRSEVRLLVDLDVGIWWSKAR